MIYNSGTFVQVLEAVVAVADMEVAVADTEVVETVDMAVNNWISRQKTSPQVIDFHVALQVADIKNPSCSKICTSVSRNCSR